VLLYLSAQELYRVEWAGCALLTCKRHQLPVSQAARAMRPCLLAAALRAARAASQQQQPHSSQCQPAHLLHLLACCSCCSQAQLAEDSPPLVGCSSSGWLPPSHLQPPGSFIVAASRHLLLSTMSRLEWGGQQSKLLLHPYKQARLDGRQSSSKTSSSTGHHHDHLALAARWLVGIRVWDWPSTAKMKNAML